MTFLKVLTWHLRKTMKISVRIANNFAKIQIRYFPNISQMHFGLNNLDGKMAVKI